MSVVSAHVWSTRGRLVAFPDNNERSIGQVLISSKTVRDVGRFRSLACSRARAWRQREVPSGAPD